MITKMTFGMTASFEALIPTTTRDPLVVVPIGEEDLVRNTQQQKGGALEMFGKRDPGVITILEGDRSGFQRNFYFYPEPWGNDAI